MSFLTLDVGNTRLKWALYSHPLPGATLLRQGVVFLEHIDALGEQDWGEQAWASLPKPTAMLGCIVAGDAVRRRVEEQLEPWDLNHRWVVPTVHEAGLRNGYDHPSRLGADRWVAMVGAWHHPSQKTQPLQPLLVVMIGTAVTVDAVSPSGDFLGGLILPGHGIMLKALTSGTAGLHVPTGEVKSFPTNTSDALTSGGTFAITGAIAHSAEQLRRHYGVSPRCLVTGGAGWKVSPHLLVEHEMVDSLIFDGLLAIAAAKNVAQASPRITE